MKKTLIAFCCAASVHSLAQITINSNHLPNSGDLLFTREATLLTDIDLDATGPNYTWNFGDDVIQPGALDAGTECVDMGSLSLVDQLFFNNPLFPEYNSDFGIGADMLVDLPFPIPIAIEDAYQIYKNSGGVYAMTGVVATVEGVPLNAQYDDRDIIYNLPLTYNSSGSSHSVLQLDVPTIAYYGTDQYRDYQCDGWGTLNLYGQTFDVLKVKSTLTGFDSIFVSGLGGTQFPKDITTYQWLSTEFKVPVLEITSTLIPIFGVTQITARTIDLGVGIEEAVSNSLSVFPNPTSGEIVLSEGNSSDYYVILNSSGQKVKEGSLLHKRIDTQSLASGLYFIRLERDGITQQTRFVKQ